MGWPMNKQPFYACTDRALGRGWSQDSHVWLGEWGGGWRRADSSGVFLTADRDRGWGTRDTRALQGIGVSSSGYLGAEHYTGDRSGGEESGSREDKTLLQP